MALTPASPILPCAGYKKMQQTKRMAVFGASLSVLSSALFYVSFVLWLAGGHAELPSTSTLLCVNRSPWLNPWIFGVSMDFI
jgi:hypothetical protein